MMAEEDSVGGNGPILTPIRGTLDRGAASATQGQPKNGVLVLFGYGVRIAVERGHLVVSDGIGRDRRSGTLNRATCGLKRLVVLGHSGTVSLEALRWIRDIGASFVQLDADGTVIIASGPSGLDDARLRRAQALAATNGIGVAIARDLLRSKLEGQADVLTRLPDTRQFIRVIQKARDGLADAATPTVLRSLEAQAANVYWSAWSTVTIRFARRDQFTLPAHWSLFLTRSSPVSGTSRSASNPINALLNFCYAILETEVRLAILAMGLDPGMGILHADLKSRDSFVYDVIEPLRPVVDGYVLTLFEKRTFSAAEFFETRQGVCRLMPLLTQFLTGIASQLAKLVAPVVEQVAQCLLHGQGTTSKAIKVPTLLSQSNRSAGRDRVRTTDRKTATPGKLSVPAACRDCGEILIDQGRQYCDECFPSYQQAHATAFSAAGQTKMAQLRAAGRDPSKGGRAKEKRGRKNSQHMKVQAAWEAENGTGADPEVFRREILPHLQDMSLGMLAKATGLSEQYCSLIRRGLYVPHPRHWETFRNLGAD